MSLKFYELNKCQLCGELLQLKNFHQYRIKENDKVIGIAVRCNRSECLKVPEYYEEIFSAKVTRGC